MKAIYKDIVNKVAKGEKLLAVLLDPDKTPVTRIPAFIEKVNQSIAQYIFVGGSVVAKHITEKIVIEIQKHTHKPVVLFPGDVTQITPKADALLFLSLLSGDNPEYLIKQHVKAIPQLIKSPLEVIPTGYILIESGKETSVQKVTQTQPIPRINIEETIHTAKAGEFLGMKLIYLEAGSGAVQTVSERTISEVKQRLNIPLIVGGGIRNKKQLEKIYAAGADIVVIGTAFEEDFTFFDKLKVK